MSGPWHRLWKRLTEALLSNWTLKDAAEPHCHSPSTQAPTESLLRFVSIEEFFFSLTFVESMFLKKHVLTVLLSDHHRSDL